jgi:3-hydroxyisobutyrate dehydrogenase-like beta-hydroxyacid dehydrogenase
MKIAFLGLGKMGVPLVNLLLRSGHTLSVWNRTPKSLKELAISEAQVAPTVEAAVADCEVVFTMLGDDEATEAVVFEPRGVIAALPKNSIHVALGTLSVALSQRMTSSHAEAGQHYVAAPVFGRPNIAAQGKLWIIAAGDTETIERVRPLLAAMGRGLTVVGEKPWQAHAAKLAGNMLITSMVQSLSEAFVFASAQGLDAELFLNTINEALFQSPFYLSYGRVMLHPPERPGATVLLGAKDTRLLREAAEAAGVRLGLADYLQQQLNAAIEAGTGKMDWAVGQYREAERASKKHD